MPDPQEPGGAAFGISPTPDEVEQVLGDAPAHTEPEQPQLTDVEVVTDEPVTIQATDEVTEAPEAQETPAEPVETPEATPEEKQEAKKFLGMFDNVEDLEAFALSLRQNESRRGNELHELRTKLQEKDQVLNEVAAKIRDNPQIQQLLQGETQEPQYDPDDLLDNPQAVIHLAEQRAQQAAERRFQELQQGITQQQTQQQAEQQRQRVLQEAQAFYADYPDAVDGTPINSQMTSLVQNYMQNSEGEWQVNKGALETVYALAKDPTLAAIHDEFFNYPDSESLDIVKEAKENPKLYRTYRAMPQLLETPDGRAMAREIAQSVSPQKVNEIQQNAQAKQREEQAAALKAATVETGGNGAPLSGAPGDRPKDFNDEILEYERKQRSGSVFLK